MLIRAGSVAAVATGVRSQPAVRLSDRRYTPGWLREAIWRLAPQGVGLDVATEWPNPMGAPLALTPGGLLEDGCSWPTRDGLAMDWGQVLGLRFAPGSALAWCNPPFSEMVRWATKALAEAARGTPIAMLTPADFTTGWWKLLRRAYGVRCALERRVKCQGPDGRARDVARSCALWGFNLDEARFARVAETGSLGEVQRGPVRPRTMVNPRQLTLVA